MSTITKFRETYGIEDAITCSFCGREMKAAEPDGGGGHYNGTEGDIFCCNRCAVQNLPRFIANSVLVNPHDGGEGARRLRRDVENHYLQGLTSRLLTALRDRG